jgi:FlaG/FlaF family flagellin (archaellin)
MVAITVILAAVIGAFVLEIGDQQETAPSSSFDSEQFNTYVCMCSGGTIYTGNWTIAEFKHAGGDVISLRQAEVKVNGNASTYGKKIQPEKDERTYPSHYPTPDVTRTLGTNERVAFESGQTWRVAFFSPGKTKTIEGYPDEATGLAHENYVHNLENSACSVEMLIGGGNEPASDHPWFSPWGGGSGCSWDDPVGMDILESGDDINAVWKASSGGKTQTLFRYTVQ